MKLDIRISESMIYIRIFKIMKLKYAKIYILICQEID